MLLSSDSVTLTGKRICPLGQSAAVGDPARVSALARSLALSFLVGGFSALRYFPTVSWAMPRVVAMALRDSPCSLACCTASQGGREDAGGKSKSQATRVAGCL